MAAITSIIVPVDGSPFGERALGTAVAFAAALSAGIVLVHVAETSPNAGDDAYLVELAATINGVDVTTRVEPNLADPDPVPPSAGPGFAVCMATHGHSGFSGAFLGGLADQLLGSTNAPFLLVGPDMDAGAIPTFVGGRVVLCHDGSTHAESIVALATDVAVTTGAGIDVVTVTHRHGDYVGDHDATRPKERVGALARDLAEQGLDVELVFLDGLDPARTITRYARDRAAQLIATSTHGSQGVVRTLIGSTAMRVVHHAPCPVLVRRPD